MTVKLLFISNLFPDTAQPIRGLDNARLLGHLARHCEVRVIALRPVPWLWPFRAKPAVQARSDDAKFQSVYRPSPYIPKIGSRWNHRLMARALRPCLRQIRAAFQFDVVLVSWLYPDACAVAELARREGFPFVAIAQGSDAHQYLRMSVRRRAIVRALESAAAVVGRSRALTRELSAAGVPDARLHAIYNGVDDSLYRPADRQAARTELGLPAEGRLILYIGNFFPIKNPLLAVTAHSELLKTGDVDARLVMLGDGPLLDAARREAGRLGNAARVQLMGRQPPERVARYLQAADLLCVPSHNEGVPNVVLEAFACGRPVVATRVGGIPEVLGEEFLGRLVEPASVGAMVWGLADVLRRPSDSERIAGHASAFSWERTAQAHFELLRSAAGC